jgi:hypothetical protein
VDISFAGINSPCGAFLALRIFGFYCSPPSPIVFAFFCGKGAIPITLKGYTISEFTPKGEVVKRTLKLLPILFALAPPLAATRPVIVTELETAVVKIHRKSDEQAAKRLSELNLTERLSTARLVRLKAELPGEKSRQALNAVADVSAFLSLPRADIPLTAAPDRAMQEAILLRTGEYLAKTMPKLPDFFATKETAQFSDGPLTTSHITGKQSWNPKLQLVGKSTVIVSFAAAKGELEDQPAETKNPAASGNKLAVEGVFGPILAVVRKDVLGSNPAWSHWELGPSGPMAVFRYQVAEEKSHYVLQESGGEGLPAPGAAYHGEIAVDSRTGAILRLTLLADPRPNGPVALADILVEYGPVELGGKPYICPVRSVALSKARNANLMEGLYVYPLGVQSPFKLEVNDVKFSQYHLFRSEMRLLPPGGLRTGGDSNSQAPPSGPAATPAIHPKL